MACLCDRTMAIVPRSFARMHTQFSPPKIPLQMTLAAKLPAPDAERMDVQLAALMQNVKLPTVRPAAGPLIGLAAQLKIVGGTFTLDDLPTLEMEMRQTTMSLARFVMPQMHLLVSLKPLPLVQLAMVARLKLAMDPAVFDEAMAGAGRGIHGLRTKLALSPPEISKLKLVAGLPPLVSAMERMKVPLGDPSRAPQAALARLQGLAKLRPPTLPITLPALMALAFRLDALAQIKAAFGPDAMSASGLSRIKATLDAFLRLPLPSPMPDLAALAVLDDLPTIDSVILGTKAPTGASALSMSPPRIAVMPLLTAVAAIRTSLNDLLGIDPWNACGSACQLTPGAIAA